MASKFKPALSILMVLMGVLHFTHAQVFVSIMPAWLPYPRELVLLSGAFEIALGIMLAIERTQVLAAWGIMALLVAVFPANVNMALHPELVIEGVPSWFPKPNAVANWLRLPFQLVFLYWAYQYTRPAQVHVPAERSIRPR